MASLTLAILIGLSASATAQVADNGQITWGSVVYTFHGEKIPDLAYDGYELTSLGANQLLNAGSVIRSRYVSPPTNGTELTVGEPINGLSEDALDNTQISIMSTTDEYVAGSALAFMQGLYPPRDSYIMSPVTELSNKTWEQYPLNGYQYPNIDTSSTLDYNYIWIAGNSECTTYSIAQVETLSSDAYGYELGNTTEFYDSLASTVFAGLSPAIVNYYNAYELYEYALYQYNHNSTIYGNMSLDTLSQLQNLASQQQIETNTPNSFGAISSIAGQTLAAKVLIQFNQIVASSGVSSKLTLLFGSYEPFLAFFALSGLSNGQSASLFNFLPNHGSVMAFELFSYADNSTDNSYNSSSPFPTTDELWVRFLFRNGTDDTDALNSYPLFGLGESQVDMSWNDFVMGMGDFAISEVVDWCSACQSINLFCEAIGNDTSTSAGSDTSCSSGGKNKKLSPAIGGVIGAATTLALFIILFIALMLFGFRLDYHPKHRQNAAGAEGGVAVLKRNGSGGGGFKGAEKLASDTDLRLKGGAGASVIRHERVGSWELNESPTSPTSTVGKHWSLDKELGRVVSTADYARGSEDGIGNVNPFGAPVKAVDQI